MEEVTGSEDVENGEEDENYKLYEMERVKRMSQEKV